MSTNSLSDLNSYSNEMVSFTDDRPFSVTVTGGTSLTNSVNASEGDTLSLLWNQTLVSIISADSSTSNNVSIEVDFSNALAPQFSWPTLPSGVTASEPSTDVYRVTGITNIADFNTLMTGATCEIVDQEANFTYTVKVEFPTAQTYTTTNTITITTTFSELTVPATAWTGDVTQGLNVDITGNATVTDTETGTAATYTMLVQIPSTRVTNISSVGGGSASNSTISTNFVRTITGTLAEVNTHLADLTLTLSATHGTLTITYNLTNNLSGVVSTGSSTGSVIEVVAFTNAEVTRTYTENTLNTNLFASSPPQITSDVDTLYGDGSYKLRLNVNGAQANPYVTGSVYNQQGWIRNSNVASKQAYQLFEITDTVANLNTFLTNYVQYAPPPATSTTQTLYITLYRTSGYEIKSHSFSVTGTANGAAVSGAGTTTYSVGETTGVTITDNMRFFLKSDIFVLGAGGHGGHGDSTGNGGGGGGAGEIDYISNSSLFTGGRDGLTTFDVVVGDAATSWNGTPTYAYSNIHSGSTVEIQATSGGQGGTAHTGPGDAGATGGYGGGGGAGTPVGAGGTFVDGAKQSNLIAFTGGVEHDFNGNGSAATSSTQGGDGGGYAGGYALDITGSSVDYGFPGPGGNTTSGNTVQTTKGSGGQGGANGSNTGRTAGQDGLVVIKLYEFS